MIGKHLKTLNATKGNTVDILRGARECKLSSTAVSSTDSEVRVYRKYVEVGKNWKGQFR
jgi:hypothetical protein